MMIDGIIFDSLTPDSDPDKTLKIIEASLDIFFKGISPIDRWFKLKETGDLLRRDKLRFNKG